MGCFLFDKIIFWPVVSRRLGISLGVNLLPRNKKICTFDCIYCECGWTKPDNYFLSAPYERKEVKVELETALNVISNNKTGLDTITFAGNGEPTLHPYFAEIVEDTISLRDKYFPEVKISVLTNGTNLHKTAIAEALKKIDNPIIKLDAGTDSTFRLINRPMIDITHSEIVKNIIGAGIKNTIIQSLFLKGDYKGIAVDNTNETDLNLWLDLLKQIKPKSVMIYSIARETPAHGLIKLSKEELESIALKVRALGIKAEAY